MHSLLVEVLTKGLRPEAALKKALPAADQGHRHNWTLSATEATDYRVLQVRDIIGLEEIAEKSLVARNYQAYSLNSSSAEKKVVALCYVVSDPRNNDLTLLITETKPLVGGVEGFNLDEREEQELGRILGGLSYEKLLALVDCTVAPYIKGRAPAKLASFLATCSCNWFTINGIKEPVPGCLHVLFVGDKRCGKGSVVRWWHNEVGLGEYGIGEAASRAGLLYYVDPDSNILVWGLLPQADMSLALIEALHGLPSDQTPELREALVQQKVTVQKKVAGEAWCRARIVADANPTKSLKEFVHPVQALRSIRCFPDPVDITRWDLCVPFYEDDVPPEAVNSLEPPPEEGLPLDLLRKLIIFAWSRKSDHILMAREAVDSARELVIQRLERYKLSDIPLIHNASLWSVLRLSIAFAVITSPSCIIDGKVAVLKEHVEMAERLVTELLERWAVKDYVELVGARPLADQELRELEAWADRSDITKGILVELASKRWRGKDLAARIGHDYSSVRHSLSDLKARGLVARKSDGYELTRKGVALAKRILFRLTA